MTALTSTNRVVGIKSGKVTRLFAFDPPKDNSAPQEVTYHGVESVYRNIVLAANEACANAIEHAYSPAPAEFEVAATRDEDQVRVIVSDSGSWRSPRGENRGRGLRIIEAAMDELEIDAGEAGTRVVMRRRLRD